MKNVNRQLFVPLLIAALFLMQGCIKDTCKNTNSYSWFEPVYKTSEEVRAGIKSYPAHEIKVPGKLFIKGNYIFLNELNKGIHIIDNSNPASPVNTAFIDIPGNVDLAVKGNYLYADLYTDLLVLDITNPLNVVKTKIIDNVFPSRFYYGYSQDNNRVIYDWVRHDTTVASDCGGAFIERWQSDGIVMATADLSTAANFSGGVPVGISGSMARFALMDSYMYTVGDFDLTVFDITVPDNPLNVSRVDVAWGIETIYPFKDQLFIGGNSGMYIYNVSNPVSPAAMGMFDHARVCDPVIADDQYAYVTLRNGSECAGFLNELDVVDITNLNAPVFLKKYDLTNPHGLSKDGDWLFICDGIAGLKIFNAADANNIQLHKHFSGFSSYDVIAYNGLAIVTGSDGLYQFDYSNSNHIVQLSKISITQ